MTRQHSINAMCKACIYDPDSPGNWRQQVQSCQITTCPLYAYRPKSQSKRPLPLTGKG